MHSFDGKYGKLLQGVGEKKVIRDIRCSVGDAMERKHLITNKDLQNIKRDYGITLESKGTVLADDEASVFAWVQKMESEEFNPVLFYKRQDDVHSVIDKKDFMLVLMTNFQKNMLNRFGSNRICVDATHGISGYQFELVTILTIDDYEEGIPVAFCITSTVSAKTLTHFFNCVKSALSFNLNTRIFMSDDAVMFKNAWVSVFGPCLKYLLCAWHVDQAWQNRTASLKKDIKQDVYFTLKSLMYELDTEKFQCMLANFIEMLEEDANTKEFYDYFMRYYYSRCESWAYCFRKGARLNTNMHIESFHRTLKHIYLDGKKTKRIDKVIHELMNLVNDKNFDAYIKAVKGKITKKTTQNFKRHREAKNLNAEIKKIDNEANKWKVISDKKEYIVSKNHSCNKNCLIACRNCAVCAVAFECSCFDQQITNFICKHIHFFIMTSEEKQNFIGPLNNQDNYNNRNSAQKTLLKNPRSNCHNSNKSKITFLSTKLNMIENMDDNTSYQIMDHLNAIEHLMQLTAQNSSTSVLKVNSEPSNKKITKQKRFHSVKKSRSNKRIKLSKPNCGETAVKKAILLKKVQLSSNNSNFDHKY